MNKLIKDLLDAGFLAVIALGSMYLVDHYDLSDFKIPVALAGLGVMLFNLYWVVFIKNKNNK